MNASWTIASRRRSAVAFCLAVAAIAATCVDTTAFAADPVRVQVLWNSPSPTIWRGSIEVESGAIAEFRSLGVPPDEADVLQFRSDGIDVVAGEERAADGCEFDVEPEATLRVRLTPVESEAAEELTAELAIGDLIARSEETSVRVGDRELTIRRASHDRLKVEPLEPAAIFDAGKQTTFVSRHRIEPSTAVALDWKASLVSLRDGTVAWTEERSTEPQAEGSSANQEWDVPLPETEGVYRIVVQAFPRRFASRWYRGDAFLTGTCDLIVLGDAPPILQSDGQTVLTIRPGESSWQDRVRSVSPVRWFGFSERSSAFELGAARVEQEGDRSWLVLEPGAVRAFPLPANPEREGCAIEVDAAAGAPATIEVACCRGVIEDASGSEALPDPEDLSWRVVLVIPDLPAPAPTTSPVETLRVSLPISAQEGTLLIRAVDPQRSVRLAEIRVVEELPGATIASDREVSLAPQSRSATLAVDDVRWPRSFSDGIVPTNLGPKRSSLLQWYEAALRLARYAKAEGYDAVSIPAIAEGGALFPLSGSSPRLIEGPDAAPAEVGLPVDSLEVLLSIFDRERVGVVLAYSPDEREAFDPAILLQRWQELQRRAKGRLSFSGCLLRLPESRIRGNVAEGRVSDDDLRNFENALGLTLPSDPDLRASFLARNDRLWREWQATQAVHDLDDLLFAANAAGTNGAVEIRSARSPLDSEERPASVSLLERSGWSFWRRSTLQPAGPAQAATIEGRFPPSAPEEATSTLGIRRFSSSETGPFASRLDAAGERRLLTEMALRDFGSFVDGDATFAPTLDPELARTRRTLSALPREPFASAARRTPLGDESLRVRTVRQQDGLWVVAMNLAPWPIRGTIEFGAGEVGRMRSLTERSIPQPTRAAGTSIWSVDLGPLDVVAAKFEGGVADVADWRTIEPPPPGIEPATVRKAVDDLSRRLVVASDPAARPVLFRETFGGAAVEDSGWRVDATEGAKLTQESHGSPNDGAVAISPSGTTLRLASPALAVPKTRSATVSIVAQVRSGSPGDRRPDAVAATPQIRLVALSGDSSVTTHVSARVDLTESNAVRPSSDAPEWRQIYVPIEQVPDDFWNDWTVTLEVLGEGTLVVDELSILDGYPSPERLSAWRKQLAIAEYALREERLFAAYEALNSPSMRLVRERFALPDAAGKTAPVATTATIAPQGEETPAPDAPADERGLMDRLWNWRPEPVFK